MKTKSSSAAHVVIVAKKNVQWERALLFSRKHKKCSKLNNEFSDSSLEHYIDLSSITYMRANRHTHEKV